MEKVKITDFVIAANIWSKFFAFKFLTTRNAITTFKLFVGDMERENNECVDYKVSEQGLDECVYYKVSELGLERINAMLGPNAEVIFNAYWIRRGYV